MGQGKMGQCTWTVSPTFQMSEPSEFVPKVVQLNVPRLQDMNLDRLAILFRDLEVRVIDGHPKSEMDSHFFAGSMTVSEFIQKAKASETIP